MNTATTTTMPDRFDALRYPRLKRIAHSRQYGRMELIEVNETSDGFLLGQAIIGEGDNAFVHSVFLGRVADFK